MSTFDDFARAYANEYESQGLSKTPTGLLLTAIRDAWAAAEAGFPSEVEANRWSPVCSAACKVVGLS